MVIEPTGAKKIIVPPIQVVLGKIPLRRTAKTKTGPTIERLHINRQWGIEQSVVNEVKRKPG